MEAIASRMKPIALRVEANASRLEASIDSRVEAIAKMSKTKHLLPQF